MTLKRTKALDLVVELLDQLGLDLKTVVRLKAGDGELVITVRDRSSGNYQEHITHYAFYEEDSE